jgi:hypothetical protein
MMRQRSARLRKGNEQLQGNAKAGTVEDNRIENCKREIILDFNSHDVFVRGKTAECRAILKVIIYRFLRFEVSYATIVPQVCGNAIRCVMQVVGKSLIPYCVQEDSTER